MAKAGVSSETAFRAALDGFPRALQLVMNVESVETAKPGVLWLVPPPPL